MADRECHHWKRLVARVMNNRLVSRAIALARLRSHFLLDIIGARLARRFPPAKRSRNLLARFRFVGVNGRETFIIHLRVLNSPNCIYVYIHLYFTFLCFLHAGLPE
jgi:hypothetical protein